MEVLVDKPILLGRLTQYRFSFLSGFVRLA